MDVHYRSKQWENTREGIRDFIELGSWGKGGIDTMKDVTKNLEDASDAVRRNDPDGVVSFSYKSDENKYQQLYNDYRVLEKFTAKVGNIVEDTIDQPFYEDIDKFVHTVRDASISNYTTKNHIGAVEVKSMHYGYGAYSEYETEKKEINIDDILSGDNYYADQIKTSFAEYKAENPDEDISEEDYRTAAVNTRAFEYESIEDDQFTKEFWINIAALVVTVAVTVVCPPAGFVLGAAYASAEMGSAISGKDWASGRELDTSERWVRGIAAPVDILPVGKAATTFTGTARTTNKVVDLGSALNKSKLSSSLAGETALQTSKVKQLVETAGQQTSSRLRNASHSVKNSTSVLKNKLGEEAIKAAQKGDAGITKVLNMFPQASLATDNGIMFASPGNFNKLEAGTAKVVDRLGSVSKGTGNTVNDYLDDIIVKGDVDAVKMNKLKNAIQNNTFSVDELSEIRKRMFELGISKEYDEVLIKMDFGKYLRGLIGDPPTAMINPHAHHILFKKGLGQKQQELVREGQEILKRYGIDPIIGKENLVWAPNAVVGQHSLDALEEVVNRLKAVELEGGDLDDIVETLEELGVLASRR
ncbi:A nuclease family of the HNH/ENDO VII superfamily with conserved AHH [Terribacillus aidingensis]|uniref:A nuclease family of the HNH/ENDO VII superfamily with conserved AHH n=1 Tax=Terribacillus aidingensis TaxID=586416 RepID=A0A285NX18_9BACI|nr:AHH domain-containing protein [Terribacillus aidingensis]SNZ14025.1 A nuclease family of the HNH/ENDO VII superfamily with conserved AHH [Terribacillus aidingensis]